jgi:DNA-binding transcriptional MerR regulator
MAKTKQISLFDFDFTEPVPVVEDIIVVEEVVEKEIIAEKIYPEPIKEPIEKIEPQEITNAIDIEVKKSTRGRQSLKTIDVSAEEITVPNDENLFSKQYYTMREVTQMFSVNHSLIRYWESEFDVLQPRKNKKGDRLFRPEDVKNLEIIYYLLRQKKYTIEGAKDYIKKKKKILVQFEAIQQLEKLKSFLLEIKANLS